MFHPVVEKSRMRRLRFPLVAALALVLLPTAPADVVEQGVRDAKASGLSAGVAKVNIEPAIGIPHQNWGSATHIVAKDIDPAGMFIRRWCFPMGNRNLPWWMWTREEWRGWMTP